MKGPAINGETPYTVVQWESACFFAATKTKGEKLVGSTLALSVVLVVSRLGNLERPSQVTWSTADFSALEGVHYLPVEKQVVDFSPGESYREVEVFVLPAKEYSGVLEFMLKIDPGSEKNTFIGKYLHSATVRLINPATFPNEKLRPLVEGGRPKKIEEVKFHRLIRDFIWLSWHNPVCRKGTKKLIFLLQYQSLVAVLNIFIMLWVARTVSDNTLSHTQKNGMLMNYGILWLVPFAGTHYLNYRAAYWKVAGSLNKQYRMLLLKRYLNYTASSRSRIHMEQLLMGMVRDVSLSVGDGYVTSVQLVCGTLTKIVYLMLGTVYIGLSSPKGLEVKPLVAACVLPILNTVFLRLRHAKIFDLRTVQFGAENDSTKHVINTLLNYQVVVDYEQRSATIAGYAARLDAENKAAANYNATVVNTLHFAPWLTTSMVALYLWFGGGQVAHGETPLPAFLAVVATFRMLGLEYEKAYLQAVKITSAYASVVMLTTFLNLPIDSVAKMQVNLERRAFGRELRAKAILERTSPLPADSVAADELHVVLSRIYFAYTHRSEMLVGKKEKAAKKGGGATKGGKHHESNKAKSAKTAKSPPAGVVAADLETGGSGDGEEAKEGDPLLPKAKEGLQVVNVETEDTPRNSSGLAAVNTTAAAAAAHFVTEAAAEAAEALEAEAKAGLVALQATWRRRGAKYLLKKQLEADGGSLFDVSMDFPQGSIVAVVGSKSAGKATVLRLLSGQLLPILRQSHNSKLFVPPHLRVAQVTESPQVFGDQSVLENLLYGVGSASGESGPEAEERCRRIVERLGLTQHLQGKRFKERGYLGPSGSSITRSDRQLLSIGRALVMNPEVIVIHKPDNLLDEEHQAKVLSLFKEYVERRGVCMDPAEPLLKRRKRTLVYTSQSAAFEGAAHLAFEVHGSTVTQVKPPPQLGGVAL